MTSDALRSFPSGELLLDQQRYDDAVEKFDSAIAIVKEQ